ncbi:687_t:CDS:1, partial [Scutellospora calospora]
RQVFSIFALRVEATNQLKTILGLLLLSLSCNSLYNKVFSVLDREG